MTHLWLLPTRPVTALPIPEPAMDCRHFHSDDPAQLATWLRAGRGPTCRNDAALLAEVQELMKYG